jgi:hypothetical protein
MTKVDDRTDEQKKTHRFAVVAKDKFMSGWGGARGGDSCCAWACASMEIANEVEKWVANRDEMRYVRLIDFDRYRAPRNTAHLHIYVVGENHPALPHWMRKSPLPAFRVRRSDGSSYVTSMAHGVTLGEARAYFVGQEQYIDAEETQSVTVTDVTEA